LARVESLSDRRQALGLQTGLIGVEVHCLICGRPLPRLRRWLGGGLCYRRECQIEYDTRQP